MTLKYFVAAGIVVVTTANCAHPVALTSGVGKDAANAGYSTYFLLQGTSSGDAAVDRQLASDVEIALAGKGWLEVAPQDAQVIVVTHVATPAKHSLDAFYRGWGDWTWQMANSSSPNEGREYTPGTVIVDGFDATTRDAFWRASASGVVTLNPRQVAAGSEHRLERLARAVPESDPRLGHDPNADSVAGTGPTIIFAQAPVALVVIDGPPSYTPIPDTAFERVVNTHCFLVRDAAGMHYLRLTSGWMEADTVEGPWTIAGTVPSAAQEAFQRTLATNRSEFPDIVNSAQRDAAARDAVRGAPLVVVSTHPVSLVVTDGQIQFEPLKGTSVLYARNASAPVFREPTDGELYVRLEDEWYRAWTMEGPWQHVPAVRLPADLARIPATFLETSARVKY